MTPPAEDTPTSYVREPQGIHPPIDYPPYKSTALRHPEQPLVYLPHTITEITGPIGRDRVPAELDPNFSCAGRIVTDQDAARASPRSSQGPPTRGTLRQPLWGVQERRVS
jgi:hypothetical protein